MLEYKNRYSPVMDFLEEGQLYDALHYWKEKLFLSDWTIKVAFADKTLTDDDTGVELSGQNQFDMVNQCCLIYLRKHQKDDNPIQKICDEHILVHELLHCKYNWVYNPNTYEGKYYDTCDHALLEQMAKSLIMTKYGLSFDWFTNFKEDIYE